MNHFEHHDLTPEERRAFDELRRHRTPPPHLEESVMNALSSRGLLSPSRSLITRTWFQIAAAFLLLTLGGMLGYSLQPGGAQQVPASSTNPQFVLLLHETPNPAGDTEALVNEYSQWARALHSRGLLVAGEKLRDSGRILTRSNGATDISEGLRMNGTSILGGYFIIQARNYDEAARIASECPHLKYGGTIELREIEPT